MNELRELRRNVGLSQTDFAALLAVPVNSFRMWDRGLRQVPPPILKRAGEAVALHAHRSEPLPLDRLAAELGVHVRTLQAAARTGRLEVQFSSRSVFGRPYVWPRALPEKGSSRFTTAGSQARLCAQRHSHACLPITTDDSGLSVTALDLPKRIWRTSSVLPARPSSISGNQERGHRRPSSGGRSNCWRTAEFAKRPWAAAIDSSQRRASHRTQSTARLRVAAVCEATIVLTPQHKCCILLYCEQQPLQTLAQETWLHIRAWTRRASHRAARRPDVRPPDAREPEATGHRPHGGYQEGPRLEGAGVQSINTAARDARSRRR